MKKKSSPTFGEGDIADYSRIPFRATPYRHSQPHSLLHKSVPTTHNLTDQTNVLLNPRPTSAAMHFYTLGCKEDRNLKRRNETKSLHCTVL